MRFKFLRHSRERYKKMMLNEKMLFRDLLYLDWLIIYNCFKEQEINTFNQFHEWLINPFKEGLSSLDIQ